MILTTQKPLEEIKHYLEPYANIMVVGCGTCCTKVSTGGEKEVSEMADQLRGKWFVDTMIIDTPCDARVSRKDWRKIPKEAKDIDALLVLSCGAGVQTLSEVANLPVFPGLNTHFLGKVERLGLYYERCRACGNCHLGETAGICPVSRCPKNLMNGPCGGVQNGKCEVGGYVRDCAWLLIWERHRKNGRIDLFRKIRSPRHFGLEAYPRGIDAIPTHRLGRETPLLKPEETEEHILAELNKKKGPKEGKTKIELVFA
jgi:hypothetical protein